MYSRILLVALTCLSFTTQAAVLEAEARAANKDEAQRQALASLANSIFVNVQSETLSHVEGSGKRHEEINIKSSSDVPLIGADINCDTLGHDVLCKVSLDSAKSLQLYNNKLNELTSQINALDAQIAKAPAGDQYNLLNQALTLLQQYEKYSSVAQMLGATKLTAPVRNLSDTEAQLRALEQAAPTMELGAQLLSKDLKATAIYVYPALARGSNEVTPFASVLHDLLASKLSSVNSAAQAQAFYKGEYEILANGIHLSYRLLDNNGNTLSTRTVMLAPAAYRNTQYQPTTMSFEKLQSAGLALSSDFRVQLSTQRGSDALLFNAHDEIELMVKLNRPGYFYVVGYVLKQADNYSYLVELGEADTDRRFVRYVGPDDANKWISIGKFEVTAPFGVDSLQLVASKTDPLSKADAMPPHQFDSTTGLYVIAKTAAEGVRKTRGIMLKKDDEYKAEAKLMFTTMP